MVSRTLFRATKSSAHNPLDNFCSVIEPLSSILQIQIQIQIQYPKRIVKPIFPFASAMSILPITALIKHKIAAENHELAIQV